MATFRNSVFSEYEARLMNFLVTKDGSTEAVPVECIGNVEEESEIRKTTKKCRGVVRKSRTKGTGAGTVKVTMHIPYDLYTYLHGMDNEELAEGVHGYGTDSMHPEVCITTLLLDEDDIEKYKAYPKCVVSTGPARKVENGAEEVAEVEVEISFMPDEHGIGIYEALAADIKDESVKTGWMEAFTPSLAHAATV